MFLQETKTKRGGKTYTSYLVRESFRTAEGPRGRTICNLTHLPKEVRDIVAHALKGQALVPLEKLDVNNIHSYGGCVVLEDAARRHGLPELLAPLTPRSAALVHAMIFGGLLFPPSVAPFHAESRSARLAMFCGLDADKERFEPASLAAALEELDEKWETVCAGLMRPPHNEVRAVTLFRTSQSGEAVEMGALGLDEDGIPVPLLVEAGAAGLDGFLQQINRKSKGAGPVLTLDEETASRMNLGEIGNQPYLVELGPETLATLQRQLNPAQLHHAMREKIPVEVRHHGERYVLAPACEAGGAPEGAMRMGSLRELASIPAGKHPETGGGRGGSGGSPAAGATFLGVTTNLPAEKLPAVAAMEWACRARLARAAFAPLQIAMNGATGEDALAWRNHQNLQFLTHRLRCHLHAEWRARGECRPVDEVLRELQEIHRATLTVEGVVVRRLATRPSKAVAALLSRLDAWELFQSPDCGRC
jgi:hypothetical protein